MTKFWVKFKSWFKPKSAPPRRTRRPKLKPAKLAIKPKTNLQPFNEPPYRQLISKIAKRAIADQRARPRRNR